MSQADSEFDFGSHTGAMPQTEQAMREHLAACYRLVAHYGWDDLIATHISARVPGEPEHFLINHFGLMFEEISASNLVKINHQGEVADGSPTPVNRAAFVIHSAIHHARPDANCIIHLHTTDGIAVSSLEQGLMNLNQTAMLVNHDMAYHEYEGVATDMDEQVRLQQDLGAKHLMLLRNHGTLAIGSSVGAAFIRAYLLEQACQIQTRTLAMNSALNQAPQEAVAKVAQQGAAPVVEMAANQLAWPSLLRKADRLFPEYKR